MKKLLVSVLALLFLTGCAGVSLKSDTSQVAADISAATIGYLVGQNNLDKIPEWNKWLDTVLEIGEGDSVISYEKLLAKGFDLVINEPFRKMQLEKLIRLITSGRGMEHKPEMLDPGRSSTRPSMPP